MNWYKRYKIAIYKQALSGEWWIIGGNAQYADGDIGDYNHEGMAIEYAQQSIMDGEGDWDEWKVKAATNMFQKAMMQANTPELKQQVQAKWDEDGGEEFLMDALREKGIDNETYQVAEMMGDPREWAIKTLGWKRLQGNNIETYNISASDLHDIANGLWDAYQEECETSEFNIYVYSQDKWYSDIPYDNISNGNIMQIRVNENRGKENINKNLDYYKQQMLRPLDGD